MTKFRGDRLAFGRPGIEPKWTHGGKDGVGTAYATSSRIWFTLWNGIITEVYYPTIDRPQIRDLQLLITDGRTFFHEEKRHLSSRTDSAAQNALVYKIVNSDSQGRYEIEKTIITDPHLSCVLQHTKLKGDPRFLSQLHVYALCAPHLEVGGWANNGYIVEAAGRSLLTAEKDGTWLAVAATLPFRRLSCGYVGQSDGWTDLNENLQMDWEFDQALDGNIALMGELELGGNDEFTLGVALGDSLQNAITTLFQALGVPFTQQLERYADQWQRISRKTLPLQQRSGDAGRLYEASVSVLHAHEDKNFPGAFIASLSIPWGESKGDEDTGGYHLVWTRDMVQSATALLACGHTETPLRALIYLAASQQDDGGFPQNFWLDGTPYWRGVQLDEIAFPVLLAWRMRQMGVLLSFDPYSMVMGAARNLILHGPATAQERWEEASGYSPSTLAANIAALICAASFARERGDEATARFIEDYADFLECHVDAWTVTTQGTLVPGIERHYIRIHPVNMHDHSPEENPNTGMLTLANRAPGTQYNFLAKEIVDPGFLELVRFGIRKPHDPIMVNSLQVVDAVLKFDTPFGPCWRRYNHDGYGQRNDGSAYEGWGTGRGWPLLTGERGHYELAAGHDVTPFLRTIEAFATSTGLLPEQVWDVSDLPEAHMFLGRPTGAAMPLMWSHAEYVKLLRSVADGKVFDVIPPVAERYTGERKQCRRIEIWKHDRQCRTVKKDHILRIQLAGIFRLHWTINGWQTAHDTNSFSTSLNIHFVDISISADQVAPIQFTFYYPENGRWEGCDYLVQVQQ
jgi:glucoamylase